MEADDNKKFPRKIKKKGDPRTIPEENIEGFDPESENIFQQDRKSDNQITETENPDLGVPGLEDDLTGKAKKGRSATSGLKTSKPVSKSASKKISQVLKDSEQVPAEEGNFDTKTKSETGRLDAVGASKTVVAENTNLDNKSALAEPDTKSYYAENNRASFDKNTPQENKSFGGENKGTLPVTRSEREVKSVGGENKSVTLSDKNAAESKGFAGENKSLSQIGKSASPENKSITGENKSFGNKPVGSDAKIGGERSASPVGRTSSALNRSSSPTGRTGEKVYTSTPGQDLEGEQPKFGENGYPYQEKGGEGLGQEESKSDRALDRSDALQKSSTHKKVESPALDKDGKIFESTSVPGTGAFPCATGLLQKRSPFIHNPPQPEERRARIQGPRTTREYIINLREDLADFQESHGLPRTRDYSFLSLGLALAQETGRALYSVFLMFTELFPILAIVSLILRFALDKLIEILETPETLTKVKKSVIFALEMLAIMIPLYILIGTIIIPLLSLLFSIFAKMLRIKGGSKKKNKSKTKIPVDSCCLY